MIILFYSLQELESDRGDQDATVEAWGSGDKAGNTRSAVVAKNRDLEYKCKTQEKELARLNEKIHNMAKQVGQA